LGRGDLLDAEWRILDPLIPDRGDRGPVISGKRHGQWHSLGYTHWRAVARPARTIRQLELRLRAFHPVEQARAADAAAAGEKGGIEIGKRSAARAAASQPKSTSPAAFRRHRWRGTLDQKAMTRWRICWVLKMTFLCSKGMDITAMTTWHLYRKPRDSSQGVEVCVYTGRKLETGFGAHEKKTSSPRHSGIPPDYIKSASPPPARLENLSRRRGRTPRVLLGLGHPGSHGAPVWFSSVGS
jgi:hypothetical protein